MRSSLLFVFALVAISACSSSGPVRRTYNNGSSNDSTSTPVTVPTTAGGKVDPVRKAQAEYAAGNYTGALDILKTVNSTKLKPGPRTEYWNLRGLTELGNKTPEASEVSFRNAVSANPNPEYAGYYQYNLASAFADEKKSDEALRVLNSIDLTHMEAMDQRKVALLKEKLARGETGSLLTTTTPTPEPSSTPAKEVYQGPVKSNRIGLLLPLSGKYESFGKKVQRAIELAFQNSPITKNNEIELIPVDSGDGGVTYQEALKKLVEENQVIAVIGPLLSKGVETLSEKADFYQVPLVSIAQVQGPASTHLYSCSISSQDQATKIVNYAIQNRGFKKFAILAPSNKPGEEMAHAFWDQVLTQGGEIKAFELYEPGLNDFREPVDKSIGLFYTETRAKEIKDLADKRKELNITKKTMKTQQYFSLPPIVDFDAVFIADEAKTVGQIIPTFAYRDAKNLSYLGISSWNSPQLVTRAGDQAEGSAFPVAFNTLNPPAETKRFYDLYNATYQATPGELDAIAYDAASAVLEVLKDSPSSREAFNEKLEMLANIEGATGNFSIKDHRCSRDLAVYTVKKGQFEAVKAPKAE
jgi:ABC-type branched-subunit amino acid transport system substrate-binding protein